MPVMTRMPSPVTMDSPPAAMVALPSASTVNSCPPMVTVAASPFSVSAISPLVVSLSVEASLPPSLRPDSYTLAAASSASGTLMIGVLSSPLMVMVSVASEVSPSVSVMV